MNEQAKDITQTKLSLATLKDELMELRNGMRTGNEHTMNALQKIEEILSNTKLQ